MKISVAMATYNGKKYVADQLDSILKQLNPEDEIIISDDSSNDGTFELLKSYQQKDKRISVYTNKNKGIISNFENAITNCNNEIIFLSDQDDIWLDNKVEIIKECFFDEKVTLVLSDCYVTDGELNIINDSFFEIRKTRIGIINNIIKNSYIGCAMAFRKELKSVILPIPEEIPMHDSWIGILAEMYGKVLIIPDKLFYYRRHDSNATKIERSNLIQMLIWRKNLIKHLFNRKKQIGKIA
jgi:glycosyltransferase involved in cell wall biosynthesis